jgi:hypothetical protein
MFVAAPCRHAPCPIYLLIYLFSLVFFSYYLSSFSCMDWFFFFFGVGYSHSSYIFWLPQKGTLWEGFYVCTYKNSMLISTYWPLLSYIHETKPTRPPTFSLSVIGSHLILYINDIERHIPVFPYRKGPPPNSFCFQNFVYGCSVALSSPLLSSLLLRTPLTRPLFYIQTHLPSPPPFFVVTSLINMYLFSFSLPFSITLFSNH